MDRLLIIQIAYSIALLCGGVLILAGHLYVTHKERKQREAEFKARERFLDMMDEYRDGDGE